MRTTLNLDEDVLLAVKQLAQREGRSAGEVLSDLARRALTGRVPAPREATGEGRHGFRPLPTRGRPVSNALIDQLREEDPE